MRTTTLPEPLASCLVEALRSGPVDLPILPEAAQRVLQAGADELELRELSQLIHRDQALAAHVLRIANSPAFLATSNIVSLQQAVVRLGFAALKQIVITVALRSRIFEGGTRAAMARLLFKHSAATGAFAKEVARARRANVEEAFLAGLLHDVGKPVVLFAIARLERSMRLEVREEDVSVALSQLHAEAGLLLADRWSLPAAVRDAIRHHHAPDIAGAREATWTTALANRMAHAVHAPPQPAEALGTDPAAVALNLYPDEVGKIFELKDQVGRFVEAFG